MAKTIDLDFSGLSLGSLVTFTRASTGTYYDASGTLLTAGINTARFDFDPSGTPTFRGLLIEETRTNSLLRSEQLDDTGGWGATGLTVSADAVNDVTSALAADKLVEDTSTGLHYIGQIIAKAASSITYAFSMYVKGAGRTRGQLECFTGGGGVYAPFDLSAVTIDSPAAYGAGYTAVSTTIKSISNSWYRVTMTLTTDATTSLNNRLWLLDAGGSQSYVGDGSSGLYAWGVQLEAGSFATSYIATTSAAVARSADVATITGTSFSNNVSQSTGTVYAEAEIIGQATNPLVSINDNTANEHMGIFAAVADTNTHFKVIDGGVSQADVTVARSALTAIRIAGAYTVNDLISAYNGTLGTNDTSGSLPTTTQMMLGADASSNAMNGWLKRVKYFDTRLTNAQLQALTASGLFFPCV